MRKTLTSSYPFFVYLNIKAATSICSGSTYSYDGSGDCSPCPLGATFISNSLGCAPATLPADTKFYLSGTQSESLNAFSTSTTVLYSTDVFGTADGAMDLANNGVISLMGSTLSSTMPQFDNDFTLSAWINAPPQFSSVLGWGDLIEPDRGLYSTKTASIFVGPGGTTSGESLAFVESNSNIATRAVSVGPTGTVYVLYSGGGKVVKFVPGNTPNDFITPLSGATGIDVDVNENIWILDTTNPTIVKKYNSLGGLIFSVNSGCPNNIGHIAADSNGNYAYYVCRSGTSSKIKKISSDGSTIIDFVSIPWLYGIAVDKLNNVFVTTNLPGGIMKISPEREKSTLVNYGLYNPNGILVDKLGNIMVADESNRVVKKVSPSGVLTNFISVDEYYPTDVAQAPNGDIYVAFSYLYRYRPKLFIPICDSTWHHVVLTRSQQSQLTIFIDGKFFSQHALSPTLPVQASSLLMIGGDFKGSVSDLRIYNRALGPSETESLSHPSAASFPGQNLALHSSSPNGYTFLFSCKTGYAGPLAILSKSNPDNKYSWTQAPNCVQCEAGKFSSSQSGVTICQLCPPGTYSLLGDLSCSLCPSGTYGNRAGLSTIACSGTCPSCLLSGTVYPPASSSSFSSSLSCSSGGARAVPSDLGMRLWPAAHQLNANAVDKIIAPEATCKSFRGLPTCQGMANVLVDNVIYYVLGTAAELNMEAGEDLVCSK